MGLDTVELVMAFEEAFDVEIPDDAAENIVTMRDVIDYVYAHIDQTKWTRDQVREQVRAITSDHLIVDPNFSDDASFIDDLGAD